MYEYNSGGIRKITSARISLSAVLCTRKCMGTTRFYVHVLRTVIYFPFPAERREFYVRVHAPYLAR